MNARTETHHVIDLAFSMGAAFGPNERLGDKLVPSRGFGGHDEVDPCCRPHRAGKPIVRSASIVSQLRAALEAVKGGSRAWPSILRVSPLASGQGGPALSYAWTRLGSSLASAAATRGAPWEGSPEKGIGGVESLPRRSAETERKPFFHTVETQAGPRAHGARVMMRRRGRS